jgi:hypothetical protein
MVVVMDQLIHENLAFFLYKTRCLISVARMTTRSRIHVPARRPTKAEVNFALERCSGFIVVPHRNTRSVIYARGSNWVYTVDRFAKYLARRKCKQARGISRHPRPIKAHVI